LDTEVLAYTDRWQTTATDHFVDVGGPDSKKVGCFTYCQQPSGILRFLRVCCTGCNRGLNEKAGKEKHELSKRF
jgi:hypothetical protein